MKTVMLGIMLAALAVASPGAKKKKPAPVSALDAYIQQATAGVQPASATATPGSLWSPAARFADLARDFKAGQVDDVVTILVSESASAVATGATNAARASSAKYTIPALAGVSPAAGSLANLASVSGNTSLKGAGTTSRQTTLSTTLSARVTHVLPNGSLVVEGTKTVQVNSEQQVVMVRGVVRPTDLTPGNVVESNRLGDMELRINGKGVVADAVRRPNFLYRLIAGLLPF